MGPTGRYGSPRSHSFEVCRRILTSCSLNAWMFTDTMSRSSSTMVTPTAASAPQSSSSLKSASCTMLASRLSTQARAAPSMHPSLMTVLLKENLM